jgi:hypothetical protein
MQLLHPLAADYEEIRECVDRQLVSSPILWFRTGTITLLCSHKCICNVLLHILEYRRLAAIHINRKGTNNTKQYITIKQWHCYVTCFRTKSGPCVHTNDLFAQERYVISLLYTVS